MGRIITEWFHAPPQSEKYTRYDCPNSNMNEISPFATRAGRPGSGVIRLKTGGEGCWIRGDRLCFVDEIT